MKTRMLTLFGGLVSIGVMGGCVTTTVDKGPPKIGQTVTRPHPAEDVEAQEHAKQVKEETAAAPVNIPGENAPTTVTNNSSAFNGYDATATNAGYQPPTTVPAGNQHPAQPYSSPLTPSASQTGTQNGGY
ncbi:MAG TPA: hypothetical protein VG722_08140 [Tepidisphaeraceae bacterium]|nr:hypothetical protein [Tepidisphaeraceae bacterium]